MASTLFILRVDSLRHPGHVSVPDTSWLSQCRSLGKFEKRRTSPDNLCARNIGAAGRQLVAAPDPGYAGLSNEK